MKWCTIPLVTTLANNTWSWHINLMPEKLWISRLDTLKVFVFHLEQHLRYSFYIIMLNTKHNFTPTSSYVYVYESFASIHMKTRNKNNAVKMEFLRRNFIWLRDIVMTLNAMHSYKFNNNKPNWEATHFCSCMMSSKYSILLFILTWNMETWIFSSIVLEYLRFSKCNGTVILVHMQMIHFQPVDNRNILVRSGHFCCC